MKMLIVVLMLVSASLFAEESLQDLIIDKTEKHLCPECQGKKRLKYEGSFYSACHLCKGKGKLSIEDVQANGKYLLIIVDNRRNQYYQASKLLKVYFYPMEKAFRIKYEVQLNKKSKRLKLR